MDFGGDGWKKKRKLKMTRQRAPWPSVIRGPLEKLVIIRRAMEWHICKASLRVHIPLSEVSGQTKFVNVIQNCTGDREIGEGSHVAQLKSNIWIYRTNRCLAIARSEKFIWKAKNYREGPVGSNVWSAIRCIMQLTGWSRKRWTCAFWGGGRRVRQRGR